MIFLDQQVEPPPANIVSAAAAAPAVTVVGAVASLVC
jgi:hypothetical protein